MATAKELINKAENTSATITLKEFILEAENAALDADQALAMAWLAQTWFGQEARQMFLAYWDRRNSE